MDVHAAQQIAGGRGAAAVPGGSSVRVGIEDEESVFHGRADIIASVISRVLIDPPMSRVRIARLANTLRTAPCMCKAGSPIPSHSSIMAADRMAATGLAIPCPAISGAEPCDGWKTA